MCVLLYVCVCVHARVCVCVCMRVGHHCRACMESSAGSVQQISYKQENGVYSVLSFPINVLCIVSHNCVGYKGLHHCIVAYTFNRVAAYCTE